MGIIRRLIRAIIERGLAGIVEYIKLRAAAKYVEAVAKLRQGFLVLLGSILLMMLMMSGFLLVHIALFVLVPWSLPTRALILLILGVVYLGVGLVVVLSISSERAWSKFAGIDRLMEQVRNKR